MNTRFNATAITLLLTWATSEAALRSGSQYINRGGVCEFQEIMNRMNLDIQYENERMVQEACNEDSYCHGYVILGGTTFYALNSIGGLDNFLNQCNSKDALIQVKEKREETSHTVIDPERPNSFCFDKNRYSDVLSCRLLPRDCESASDDVKEDCCVCGGGRIERSNTGLDPIQLPLEGTPFYVPEETTSLVLKNNPEDFNGSIPTEIYFLTKLTTLDLSGNDFVGTIPSGIEKLTDLEELLITGNSLEGPLPDGFASLNKLRVVNIELNGM